MKFLLLISAVALASCGPVDKDESTARMAFGNFVDCVNGDMSLCFKEQALKVVERLRTVRQVKITDGITIYNNGPHEARSLELSPEPEVRKREVSAKLWESTSDLFKNSDLELSWNPDDDEEESRALDAEEGRGKKKEKKKKLKVLLSLLLLAKIKAIAIGVTALVIIAASIAKLALLAKITFIAKLIALAKHLLQKKHSEEEQTWVPHHEEHGHHDWDQGWNGGWSRSRNEAQNLAYSAYNNN